MAARAPAGPWASCSAASRTVPSSASGSTTWLTTPHASAARLAWRTASASAVRISGLTAFRRSGRLSRIHATPFSTVKRTTSVWAASVMCSPSFEIGLPLLEEGLHALFLVLGAEEEVEALTLGRQAL